MPQPRPLSSHSTDLIYSLDMCQLFTLAQNLKSRAPQEKIAQAQGECRSQPILAPRIDSIVGSRFLRQAYPYHGHPHHGYPIIFIIKEAHGKPCSIRVTGDHPRARPRLDIQSLVKPAQTRLTPAKAACIL